MQRDNSEVLSPSLLTAQETAEYLCVSESWVRRHVSELPAVKVGRNLRFDQGLLLRKMQGTIAAGNRLGSGETELLPVPKRYQEGSVYKRGKHNKTWYGMFRADVRLADGEMVRKQRKVRLGTVAELPTRMAAKARLSQLMGEALQAPSVEMLFAELAGKWRAVVLPTKKGSSAKHYEYALTAYLMPALGPRRVSGIGRYDVEAFLTEKAQQGYAKNTLRSMRATLSCILTWAVDCGWIDRNPVHGVKLPRAGKKITRTILSAEQVLALSGDVAEPYSSLILFLASTGLRIGEALGLRWSDFQGDTFTVNQRVYNGKPDTTKSKDSRRSIPLPAALLARLKELGGDGEMLVFRSKVGTPLSPQNAMSRYIGPAAEKLEIPLTGFHDFRHTASTKLLRSGVTASVVSKILGHSSVGITLNTYDHPETAIFGRR